MAPSPWSLARLLTAALAPAFVQTSARTLATHTATATPVCAGSFAIAKRTPDGVLYDTSIPQWLLLSMQPLQRYPAPMPAGRVISDVGKRSNGEGIDSPFFNSPPYSCQMNQPPLHEDFSVKQVDILVTHACNLHCKYCYETHKAPHFMTADICKRELTAVFREEADNPMTKSIGITFLGGEPLLNFPVIKEVSEWLWGQEFPLPYTLEITTNGTTVTPEVKEWLLANKHRLDVGLSMDGLSDMQKNNRTDKPIDIDFFVRNWPQLRVNMVLFCDSIHLFADTVLEMKRQGVPFSVAIGNGFVWSKESVMEYERQMERLIPHYADDLLEARRCGIFMNPEHCYREIPDEVPLCSPKNSNKICIDAFGRRYGCHLMSPLTLGEQGAAQLAEVQKAVDTVATDPRCHGCPLFHTCKSCPAMNLKVCGDVARQAAYTTCCLMQKVQARQTAVLYCLFYGKHMKQGCQLSEYEQKIVENALRLLEDIPPAEQLVEQELPYDPSR